MSHAYRSGGLGPRSWVAAVVVFLSLASCGGAKVGGGGADGGGDGAVADAPVSPADTGVAADSGMPDAPAAGPRPPTLGDPGGPVFKLQPYWIRWTLSPDDLPDGGAGLVYELQEARGPGFANPVTLPAEGTATLVAHPEVARVGGRIFYYRMRVSDAGGLRSDWSNVVSKLVLEVVPSDQARPVEAYVGSVETGAMEPPVTLGAADIILDDEQANNGDAGTVAYTHPAGWLTNAAPTYGYLGGYHYITSGGSDGSERATWTPTIATAGRYEVWVSFWATTNRAAHVYYYVEAAAETALFEVNQLYPVEPPCPTGVGMCSSVPRCCAHRVWARLGTFRLAAGREGFVNLVNGPDHSECADAALFRWVGP